MLRRIVRPIVLAAAVSLAGCSSGGGGGFHPFAGNNEPDRAQLAAYAANTKYPGDAKPSTDFKGVALVNSDRHTLRIYNFGETPLTGVTVWVDKTYVAHTPAIAARGSVTLPMEEFYDGVGTNMLKSNFPVKRVQVQSGDQLYDLWGPAAE